MRDAEEVNREIDLLSIIPGLELVATTGGGEFAGACPFCGGEDRFRVQRKAPPGKRPQGQRWLCRGCSEKWGDGIGYIMRRDNMTFQEVIEQYSPTQAKVTTQPAPPAPQEPNRSKWEATAKEFVEECAEALFTEDCIKPLEYLHNRGLSDDTLREWKVGYNLREGWGNAEEWGLSNKPWLAEGITIPCMDQSGLHYVKVRRRKANPKERYLNIKGGEGWLFGIPTLAERQVAFLFEGEFDALLARQVFSGIGTVSLPAGQPINKWAKYLEGIEELIVAYDNDEEGKKNSEKLCKLSPHIIPASPLPEGKDLSEYYQATGSLQSVFDYLYYQLFLLDTKK